MGGVTHGDAPAVDLVQTAALDEHIVILGLAGGIHIGGLVADQVDTAVAHMLVVDIAHNIADIQILQIDVIHSALVLGNTGNTGAVHAAGGVVDLACLEVTLVGHGDVADLDVLHIEQQDAGGHITLELVIAVVQRHFVVLVPDALAVGLDQRLGGILITVDIDDDGGLLTAGALDMQVLIDKDGAPLQQDPVTGPQGDLVDLKQAGERCFFAGAVVAFGAMQGADEVGGAAGSGRCFGRMGAQHRHTAEDHYESYHCGEDSFDHFHSFLSVASWFIPKRFPFQEPLQVSN